MARPVKNSPEKWREIIIQVAQKLFYEKGYEATSINDIMDMAGGAKGLFYRFFENKDKLLAAIVNLWADDYAAIIKEILTNPALSFESKFDNILTAIIEMTQRTSGIKDAFVPSNFMFLTALTTRITEILIPIFAEVLDTGIKQGVLKISEPMSYARFIVHGALGMLNSGDGTPSGNVSNNIGVFRKIVTNTLVLDKEG